MGVSIRVPILVQITGGAYNGRPKLTQGLINGDGLQGMGATMDLGIEDIASSKTSLTLVPP